MLFEKNKINKILKIILVELLFIGWYSCKTEWKNLNGNCIKVLLKNALDCRQTKDPFGNMLACLLEVTSDCLIQSVYKIQVYASGNLPVVTCHL